MTGVNITTTTITELVIDLTLTTLLNIQELDIKILGHYRYLGVYFCNKMDWTPNTDAVYMKGQS